MFKKINTVQYTVGNFLKNMLCNNYNLNRDILSKVEKMYPPVA